ncbi:MAG: hypothetical protein M0T84_08730 [Betaproteobacteria bacterium]|nr:hypothetical protein [Betaproteobacteria bacterium]
MTNGATEKKRGWLFFRIAVLLIAVFQAKSFPGKLGGDFTRANWTTFFVLICVVAFGVLFVTSLQRSNPWSPQQWRRPSWFSSPFSFGQPLLIFDFAAYYFLVLGGLSLVLEVTSTPKTWAWELPLSVGIGAWLGVRICISVFREKFQNTQ